MHKSVYYLGPVKSDHLQMAKSLGLNSIIVNSPSLSEESIKLIKTTVSSTIEIYASLTCFEGEDLIGLFPDAYPVEAIGKDTIYGVCPTHEGVREVLLKRVENLIKLDINGLWLNHLRYPTSWELEEPDIMDTCYCDRCLRLFSEYIGEPIVGQNLEEKVLLIDGSYYIEWIEFKCHQITSFASEVRKLITNSGKSIKLGVFIIPWEEKEYGAAIKRIVSQDLYTLMPFVDTITPGLFHKWCGKDVEWIKDKVNYFWETGKPQLPIIQSIEVNGDEFSRALNNVSITPSLGFCVYNLENIDEIKGHIISAL